MHLFFAAVLGLSVFVRFALALPPPLEVPRNLAPWPGDVSGPAEGALAVPVDPAAAGFAHGPELVLRRAPSVGARGFGALEIDGVLPIGPATLQAGWSLDQLPRPRARSGRLGLSVAVAPGLRVGFGWQRVQAPRTGQAIGVVDLGLALRPHPTVALSLGGESMGAPVWPNGAWSVHRALRLGVGVRPLGGSPVLTVGLDARLRVSAAGRLPETRALLDVAPWGRGLHLLAAWQRGTAGQAGWVGLRLDAWHASFGGAGRFDGDPRAGHGAERMALVARLQARPDDLSLPRPHRRLQVAAAGRLGATPRGPFGRAPVVATLAAELSALAARPELEVDELLLDVGTLDVGLASVDELRRSLAALRGRGVHVTARLSHGGNSEWLLAAAADRIEMDPSGSLDLSGFALRRHYFADALAHLGVRFEAVGVGRFKTGPDAWTRAAPRPEEGEVQQARVGTAYATLHDALQLDRRLPAARAHAALAHGLFNAEQALGHGLVDAVAPRVQADAGQIDQVPRGAPLRAAQAPSARWGAPPKIAVVPVVGVMEDGDAPGTAGALAALGLGDGAGSDAHAVADRLARAAADPTVVGIVLRVDSPGGDVFAAERVWRAVRQAAQRKPLVASLGDVAASGGYYAAVGAPTIYAERNTVTGSIGIYRLKPELSGLLELTGVHRAGRAAGEHAGWDDVEAPWSEEDRARVARELQAYYDAFVARVAAGRGLSTVEVEARAQGRVVTGEAAGALRLVDHEGGLGDAVAHVRRLAGLAPEATVALEVPDASASLLGWARRRLRADAGAEARDVASSFAGALEEAAARWRRVGRLPLALHLE